MRKLKVLALMVLVCSSVWGQDYVGQTIKLSSGVAGKKYLAGSLPKNSDSNFEKLKIIINGGGWHNTTTGENHYYISTRDGVKINQEIHGGDVSRYKLEVYQDENGYDFVIAVTNSYPAFNIRAWLIGHEGYKPIRNEGEYEVGNKTNITSNIVINSMFVTDNAGNVGIGTAKPQAKLAVEGTILAKEVKVSTEASDWPDFVFSDSYQLTPLSEVESFIKTNKHLPEIPSAAQMEEQGVNLAEMNKLLLQKVEELTLYVIDLKKENKTIKGERNREQGARIKEQAERKKLEEELQAEKEERRQETEKMEQRLAKLKVLMLETNPQ